MDALAESDGPYELAPLDGLVAAAVELIDRSVVPDMPDRIIAATALSSRAALVSRDSKSVRHRFRRSGSTPHPLQPIPHSPDFRKAFRPAFGITAASCIWYTPGREALRNFPEACCRNALICSAAERDTGTISGPTPARKSSADMLCGNTPLISAPVHPSSSGRAPETPYLAM